MFSVSPYFFFRSFGTNENCHSVEIIFYARNLLIFIICRASSSTDRAGNVYKKKFLLYFFRLRQPRQNSSSF